MARFSYFFSVLGILFCQIYFVYCCKTLDSETEHNGTISESYTIYGNGEYSKCWIVQNAKRNILMFELEELNLLDKPDSERSLIINLEDKQIVYLSKYATEKFTTSSSSVEITFKVNNRNYWRSYEGYETNFILHFEKQYVDCSLGDSFHCSSNICIQKKKVCDGTKNCENGIDEVGCGIPHIKGVYEVLSKEIIMMKNLRTSSWGWHANTPRAVTALFLSGDAYFDGTNHHEDLMAKQAKLETSVALLKNYITTEELSMCINSLIVTCHSPRQFYGHNLVKRLKKKIETSRTFTHPIAYLTLCNANESWPIRAKEDLTKILSSNSDNYFVSDYKAISVMAVSCYENQWKLLNSSGNTGLRNQYQNAIQHFKETQLPDGSFGNLHSTALVTQALLSSSQENSEDWNVTATIHYIMRQLKSPHDILSTFSIIPVLNSKSLVDVSKVNCNLNPKRTGYDDEADEIIYYAGAKMRIQYSLFLGDDKDVIHTISLRVPENYTAYDVMTVAKTQDYKFNFRYKKLSGKMFVFQIGEVTNDPESGQFWLLYQGAVNTTNSLNHSVKGPDQLVMQDQEHLVMWYKKVEI